MKNPDHPFSDITSNSPGHLHRVKDRLYAVCQGASMLPTLRHGELMEIRPYDKRPVRPGDVVLFPGPEDGRLVVHRVVCTTDDCIRTRGDHNGAEDRWQVRREAIIGRVVAAWRGQRRRRLAGGTMGRLVAGYLPWRHRLARFRRIYSPRRH